MTDEPGRHCKNRLFEWTMTFALLGMGIIQIIWPNATLTSKFQFILYVIGPTTLTWLCLITAWVRGYALFSNGNLPKWGPRLRIVTAIVASSIWLQMGISLILTQSVANAPPSISVPLYFALVFAEMRTTHRAAADVRFR